MFTPRAGKSPSVLQSTHKEDKMDREVMDKERRKRRARIKARRRKARIRGLALVVVILGLGVFTIQKLKGMGGGGNTAYAYGNQAEWFVLNNLDALDDKKAYTPEEIGNLRNNIINDRIAIRLAKGENYITRAKDYAYSAADISDIIEGKMDYTGSKKIAFLTFDDGPNHKITPQILDTLRDKNAHATFFVVGKIVSEKTRDVLMRELSEGHSIAMHSSTHDYHKLYPGRVADPVRVEKEAVDSQAALQKVLGKDFHSGVWRYPGGHMSWKGLEPADQKLKDMGVSWIDWNSLSGDAEPASRRPTTEAGLVDFLNKSIKSNEDQSIMVVLMHDAENKQLTANALGEIIDHLRDEGYEFGILK